MTNQEPGSSGIPSQEQHDSEENQQSRGMDNFDIHRFSGMSLWLQGAESPSGYPTTEAHEAAHSFDDLHFLSSFDLPSPLSAQKAVSTGQTPCTKEIFHGQEKGESSGTRRKCISDSLKMQQREKDVNEDTPKEDCKQSGGCRQQKRFRSAETHNLTERLRRQRLKEKMKTLEELIPNCNKKDKASTLDDAIKYIKALQRQIQEHQMMSMGAGFSMCHSPFMMPQPGMQFPNLLPSLGMVYGLGTGSSSLNSGSGPSAFPCTVSSTSSTTSGLMALQGLSEAESFQNPGGTLFPPFATSSAMSFPSPFTTKSETTEHVPISRYESCPMVIERSILRGSRVLPSQVVELNILNQGQCQNIKRS